MFDLKATIYPDLYISMAHKVNIVFAWISGLKEAELFILGDCYLFFSLHAIIEASCKVIVSKICKLKTFRVQ